MLLSEIRLAELFALIKEGKEEKFYSWPEWRRTRADVLEMDNHECQYCKDKHKYRKAKIVHHVKHLKDRPDLALSIWDGDERQLVSLCKSCHEAEHPESQRQYRPSKPPVTAERWD